MVDEWYTTVAVWRTWSKVKVSEVLNWPILKSIPSDLHPNFKLMTFSSLSLSFPSQYANQVVPVLRSSFSVYLSHSFSSFLRVLAQSSILRVCGPLAIADFNENFTLVTKHNMIFHTFSSFSSFNVSAEIICCQRRIFTRNRKLKKLSSDLNVFFLVELTKIWKGFLDSLAAAFLRHAV